MRLRSATIRNYRSIREQKIDLTAHTAFIGANGAGKSTVLRGIQLFYEPSRKPTKEDFFCRNVQNPIEIELNFTDLSAGEQDLLGSYVSDGDLTVVRMFSGSGGKEDGRYHGVRPRHAGFSPIRAAQGREKVASFRQLRDKGLAQYSDLPSATSGAAVDEEMKRWEEKHPDLCELGKDDGQFFGFKNVGKGNLEKFTKFVFVPAVRELSQCPSGKVLSRIMGIWEGVEGTGSVMIPSSVPLFGAPPCGPPRTALCTTAPTFVIRAT
jgi:putative ATP-dependent endonuclease of the OLD family